MILKHEAAFRMFGLSDWSEQETIQDFAAFARKINEDKKYIIYTVEDFRGLSKDLIAKVVDHWVLMRDILELYYPNTSARVYYIDPPAKLLSKDKAAPWLATKTGEAYGLIANQNPDFELEWKLLRLLKEKEDNSVVKPSRFFKLKVEIVD